MGNQGNKNKKAAEGHKRRFERRAEERKAGTRQPKPQKENPKQGKQKS